MFEYHCWIASPTYALRDELGRSTVSALRDQLGKVDPYSAIDVDVRNGLLMVSISGFPNHASQRRQAMACAEVVLGLSDLARGLFMFHDDESPDHPNEYRVSWIVRSKFSEETRLDGLSPTVPKVIDP